jgi:hypothetical protein
MNFPKTKAHVRYALIVAALCLFSEGTVYAADETPEVTPPTTNAPASGLGTTAPTASSHSGSGITGAARGPTMVFDPESRKYFIGGGAKFMLRQNQDSSIIDRIEVSVDGADYIEYKDGIALNNEGKHTIKFRAINPVNSYSPVQFVELFLDTTAPLTQTKFEEGRFYRKDNSGGVEAQEVFAALNSTLSFLAQDNLSGVSKIEYSWESDSAFLPYTKPLLIDKPGKRVLYFRSTDRVGNVEVAKKVTFVADGAAPNSDLKIMGGPLKPAVIGGVSYMGTRDSVAFGMDATDTESGVREMMVSVDSKPATRFLKPIFFLQEGPHTMSYFSEDNVGNRETPKTISVYSVSTAPRTTATPMGKVVSKGGINYARKDLKLKLTAEENAVGLDRLEYRMDPSPEYVQYGEPISFTKIGENTVVFRSVDRAGNNEASRSYKVVIKENGPETKVETSQPLVVRDSVTYSPAPNTVTLRAESTGVAADKTFVSINDSPFTRYTGPIALSAEQRIWKLSFKSTDELGNEETPKTVNYHMIGSAPMVDLFVSDGMSLQEQVRTDFFDKPTPVKGKRGVASEPGKKK